MKGKRGQGLSMNTIVIAVIVLFVMVVLLLIFTGRISIFGSELKNCVKTGGQCSSDTSGNCGDTTFTDLNGDGIRDAIPDKPVNIGDESKIGCGSSQRWCCRGLTSGTK